MEYILKYRKFTSIITGILLLYFFAAIPVACRTNQSNQSGNDFSSAVNLYMSAPVNSYDYQPAVDAFSKIAIEAKDKETEFRARYFLALVNFCATRFNEAYKQADACRVLANQLYPEDIRVKIADIISSGLSGLKGDNESNFPTLNDIIITNSRIKPIMPGTSGENLLSTTETIDVLDTLAPLERMWPTPVYRNGRDKINLIRKKGNITADETLVIGMMEKNIACLKESTASQFALTCGVLALFIDKCGAAQDKVTNSMEAAICAHNLRQLGLAFHMYVLDNAGSFPPQGNSIGSWPVLITSYLGIKPEHNTLPPDSVFFCPADSNRSNGINEVQYGYNDGGNFGGGGSITFSSPAGQKITAIIPSRQLILADESYDCGSDRVNGYTSPGCSRLFGYWVSPRHNGFVNILYADGHVEADNINYLWDANDGGAPWNSNNPWSNNNRGPYPSRLWLPDDAK